MDIVTRVFPCSIWLSTDGEVYDCMEFLIRDQWMFLNQEEHPCEVSVLFLCSLDYSSRLGIRLPLRFLPKTAGGNYALDFSHWVSTAEVKERKRIEFSLYYSSLSQLVYGKINIFMSGFVCYLGTCKALYNCLSII